MLERAIGVAAICMRRLIECRLVTDRFRDSKLAVHEIHRNPGTEWREPLVSRTASEIFNNYDTKARYLEQHAPKMVADKILHSRVIGVLSRSAYLPDGLLLASDTQRKTRLFHFTAEEIVSLFDAILNDEVTRGEDGYAQSEVKLQGTLKVFAVRA